jgi:hypothetical protein
VAGVEERGRKVVRGERTAETPTKPSPSGSLQSTPFCRKSTDTIPLWPFAAAMCSGRCHVVPSACPPAPSPLGFISRPRMHSSSLGPPDPRAQNPSLLGNGEQVGVAGGMVAGSTSAERSRRSSSSGVLLACVPSPCWVRVFSAAFSCCCRSGREEWDKSVRTGRNSGAQQGRRRPGLDATHREICAVLSVAGDDGAPLFRPRFPPSLASARSSLNFLLLLNWVGSVAV